MFRNLAIVLVVLWLIGFFGFPSAVAGFIHSLLLLAIVFVVVDFILRGKKRGV